MADDHQDDLGQWINRKCKAVEGQRRSTSDALSACGISKEDLRVEWQRQREAQSSVRARMFFVELAL